MLCNLCGGHGDPPYDLYTPGAYMWSATTRLPFDKLRPRARRGEPFGPELTAEGLVAGRADLNSPYVHPPATRSQPFNFGFCISDLKGVEQNPAPATRTSEP